ncbi:MAG: tetratricopeptide repeat protein [Dehalococcoidia bacterium]
MNLVQTDEKLKLRRNKSREAVQLALAGRWEEAVRVNGEILEHFPEDVEALNRLGKAFIELGRYDEAQEAFQRALRYSPHNAIAKKNLSRLTELRANGTLTPTSAPKVAPTLFIEESGKSGTTQLINPAPPHILAKMAAGDAVTLKVVDHSLLVENQEGEYLGQVEPRLGRRLTRLIRGGNCYEAAITSVNRNQIALILREVYRHPSLAGIAPFPSAGGADYRAYLRDTLLRYRIEEEIEDAHGEPPTTWQEEEDELVPSEEAPRGAMNTESPEEEEE